MTGIGVLLFGSAARKQHFQNFLFVSSYNSAKGKVVIKSGSTLPTLKTILPQGLQNDDYNVTIQVEIVDALGAASSEILVVKVGYKSVLN